MKRFEISGAECALLQDAFPRGDVTAYAGEWIQIGPVVPGYINNVTNRPEPNTVTFSGSVERPAANREMEAATADLVRTILDRNSNRTG